MKFPIDVVLLDDGEKIVQTKINLKLTKKGPCTVYSEDLQGPAEVVFPKIPITILGENHKLELVATAALGTSRQHAKHLPGLCYYRHILEVKSSPHADKIIGNSTGLLKAEKKGSKWLCDLNDAEANEIEKAEKGAVTDSQEILFIIESFGNMPAKDILQKTIEALEGDLDEFEKGIK